jgi:hypothetical protein
MGFYYGSGAPPPEDDDKVRFREVVGLVFAMFKVLSVPFAIMFGGMLAVLALFLLFTVNLLLGYAVMGIGIGALIVHAMRDSKSRKAPPE